MWARGAAGLVVVMLLSGCAGIRWVRSLTGPPAFNEGAFARKPIATYRIPAAPDDTVIGRLGTYRIRAGETFFEVARYYDLGYGELVEANPGIDPILPPVGARVVLNRTNRIVTGIQRGSQLLMNVSGITALDEVHVVAVAGQ